MRDILIRILVVNFLNISFAVCSIAQSTSGKIEGFVTSDKGEPMEFVTVLLRQPQDSSLIAGTTTSGAGQYTFASIPHGKYILTATFVGYEKQSAAIEFQSGEDSYLVPTIVLKEDARLLGEVVVRGHKLLIEQDGDKLILNVQNSVVAAGGNAADLLSRVPGVSLDQNDQISLNGKQGVTIMIDGKITYLPPSELGTMLRSMNANNIATVEVINNPSARYDATGNSGMINIKTKKNTADGFNGSATIGGGYGRYGKANGNVNLNYRIKKWNHFFNYGYNFDKRPYSADADRVSNDNGKEIAFIQVLHRIQQLPSHTWQGGSEFQWNSKNSIVFNTTGSYNERSTNSGALLQIKPVTASEADSTFMVTDDQMYRWYNLSASLGYKHIFTRPGTELTVDFDHSRYGFSLTDNYAIRQLEKDGSNKKEYNVLSDQPSKFNIYAARADYTHRLNEQLSFETGVKYSHVETINDVRFSNNLGGVFEEDTLRSSDFNYVERIGAAYINVKTTLFGFATQLGLGAEQTQYEGFSVRANKSIERNYLRFFPSVNLNREFSRKYQLGLSYSYRIDRPSYRDLYPYVYFYDPFDSQFGNPGLLPQFTHNIQVSQTIARDYVVNAGYSSITQYMAYAILLYEDQVSSYAIKQNFDTFQNYYITGVAPVKITKNWTMNCSLNLFYINFNTRFLNDIYRSTRFSGIVNLSQTITLPWGMTGEITAVYNAPAMAGLFETKAMGSLNAGIQKQFFDRKATLRLSIADIFQTNRIRNMISYPGLEMNIYNFPETRIVRVKFTCNFGKATGKALKKRNTLEDEQKRIGG